LVFQSKYSPSGLELGAASEAEGRMEKKEDSPLSSLEWLVDRAVGQSNVCMFRYMYIPTLCRGPVVASKENDCWVISTRSCIANWKIPLKMPPLYRLKVISDSC